MPVTPDTGFFILTESPYIEEDKSQSLANTPTTTGKREERGSREKAPQYLLELYPPSVKLVLHFLEIKIAALSANQLAFSGNWLFLLLFGLDIIEHPFAFGCGCLRCHSSGKQYNTEVTHRIKVYVLDIQIMHLVHFLLSL